MASKVTSNGPSQQQIAQGTTTLVQGLECAIQAGNWPLVSQEASQLLMLGRIVIVQNTLHNDYSFSPLRIAENLLQKLHSSVVYWEDDIKYPLARVTRLFFELSCMKAVSQKRSLDSEIQNSFREHFKTLLDKTKEEEVALRHELRCCLEAFKLMEETDYKKYLFALLEAAKNPSIDSALSLFTLIPDLISKRSKGWFSDTLFINWFTVPARTISPIYSDIVSTIEEGKNTLDIALAGVEFFADILLHGTPELQNRAINDDISLLFFLNQKRPSQMPWKHMWPVRYRAAQILINLPENPHSLLVHKALLAREEYESNKDIRKLIKSYIKKTKSEPEVSAQFKQNENRLIQQNLVEAEVITEEQKQLLALRQLIEEMKAASSQDQEKIKKMIERIEELKKHLSDEHNSLKWTRVGNEFLTKQIDRNAASSEEVRAKLETIEKLQHSLAQTISASTSNASTIEKLEKDLELKSKYVKELEEENAAHRLNVAELHELFNKKANAFVDEMLPAQSVSTVSIPVNFYCSITGEIMEDPVLAEDGYSFEGWAIRKWLAINSLSPVTWKPLDSAKLIPNRALKGTIDEFRKTNNLQPKNPSSNLPQDFSTSTIPFQSVTRNTFSNLIVQILINDKVIKSQDLVKALDKIFNELGTDNSTTLPPKLGQAFTLAQNLIVNGKILEFPSRKLVEMYPSEESPLSHLAPAPNTSNDRGLVLAQDFTKACSMILGKNGYRQDIESGLALVESCANDKHARSLFIMGWVYDTERGKYEAQKKALERDATRGSEIAAICLVLYSYSSLQYQPNPKRSFTYYDRSAGKEYPEAIVFLARWYIATGSDSQKAFEQYKIAADTYNHPVAQRMMGRAHDEGKILPQSDHLANKYYRFAVENEDPIAPYLLAIKLSKKALTNEEKKEVAELFEKSATEGHREAQYNLALCYQQGYGKTKDPKLAFEWFEKSSENGCAPAQLQLSRCYLERKDIQMANRLLQQATPHLPDPFPNGFI